MDFGYHNHFLELGTFPFFHDSELVEEKLSRYEWIDPLLHCFAWDMVLYLEWCLYYYVLAPFLG